MEGSVQVQRGGLRRILKPGEQLLLPAGTDRQLSIPATGTAEDDWQLARFDEQELLAWKRGCFKFSSTELPVVLRRLGRWYGFEPIYPSGIPRKLISGEMQQDLSIPGLLQVLSTMKINCRLEGDKLIVIPD